jgi:hypothetical protein
VPPLSAALPPALSGWSWPAFWLVCPSLVLAVLLGVVSLVTLFRAPRTDAVRVLSIFVSAFRRAAGHTPVQGGSRPELDSDTGSGEAECGGTEIGEGEEDGS